jgi:hypothetical protein
MKRESHDIDIALDNQTGIEFAESVNEYLASIGLETRSIGLIQVIKRFSSKKFKLKD